MKAIQINGFSGENAVDGKWFTFYPKFSKCRFTFEPWWYFDTICDAESWVGVTWDINMNYPEGYIHFPYWMTQELIKWKMDVFLLIPKGLAEDLTKRK